MSVFLLVCVCVCVCVVIKNTLMLASLVLDFLSCKD